MESITAPIITGIFGLIGGALTNYKDDLKEMFFSKGRRSVKGQWEGKGHDIEIKDLLEYDDPENYSFIFRLTQKGMKVSGEFSLKSDAKRCFVLERARVEGDYLRADYSAKDPKNVSSGHLLLYLH